MCSPTFLLTEQYIVSAVIGFTLFGFGLGFYAAPSTDAALMNVPQDKVGTASEVYKMACSLGNAIGVATSAAVYVAAQNVSPELLDQLDIFIGRQDNVALRFGGVIGLLFNVLLVGLAIALIILTLPKDKTVEIAEDGRPERKDVPPLPIGN